MTNGQNQFDVAIIGTGPAGLVAALKAQKAGLNAALVGPAVNTGDARTTALLAPSLDAMDRFGLSDQLADIGTPLMTMRLLDGSSRLIRAPGISFEAEEIGRSLFGLNCKNAQLNAMLDAAVAATGTVQCFESFVVGFDLTKDTRQVTLQDGHVLQASAIIAADGRNSPARDAAGIAVRRWSYPQTAAVGIVKHTKRHDYISTELHTETGPYTFVPLPDDVQGEGRSSFVCVLAPKDADALAAMNMQDASRFLQNRSLHVLGQLTLEKPVQCWPLEGLVANAFAQNGVFLVGETAHAFPPIGAQGLNLSIRDAGDAVDVAAAALRDGEDAASRQVAVRYSAKRRSDVWARTFGVDALNRSLLSNMPLMHVGRALAMGATKLSPTLKKGLMVAGLEPFSLQRAVGGMIDQLAPSSLRSRSQVSDS